MNIDAQLRNLFANPPSHPPKADAQPSAPSESRAQQGARINYGGNQAKSPASTANAGGNGQATKREANPLSSFLSTLMKMLGGSDQQKPQPDAQASNTGSQGASPHANNQGNSANRMNGSALNNQQPDAQASNSGKSVAEPKNGSPYSADDLVDGFRQKGGTENCVTVGGIKAAMQEFGGPKEVYSSVEKNGDGYDVKMRDDPNKTYHVTNDELKEAAQKSGFEGKNPQMLNDANFMYAVSAKREQMENKGSFSQSLGELNRVQDAIKGFERLGLQNHVQHTVVRELVNGASGVIAQDNHVAAVLDGKAEDYGKSGRTPDTGTFALKLV